MAPPPTTRPSIKVTKRFKYRGADKRWSNRYYFTLPTPAGTTEFETLSDNVANAEIPLYLEVADDGDLAVEIVQADIYAPGSDVPIFTKEFSLHGSGNWANHGGCPGDCAAFTRYLTDARTSKNHPVYLFNFYHGAKWEVGTAPDNLNLGQRAALEDYAAAWIAGFTDGTNVHHRCGPYGAVALSRTVFSEISHRDFPN